MYYFRDRDRLLDRDRLFDRDIYNKLNNIKDLVIFIYIYYIHS